MIAHFSFGNRILKADLTRGCDVSLPAVFGPEGCRAWHAPPPQEQPLQYGRPAAVAQGFSVNSFEFRLAPHSHCTHTEWQAHYLEDRRPLPLQGMPVWMPALLISVFPFGDNGAQKWIRQQDLKALFIEGESIKAILVRTLPNPPSKGRFNYSGSRPPAFQPEALKYLRDQGIEHLLTDLPSVDPEEDYGLLNAHKTFLATEYPLEPLRTITELIYVPDSYDDGLYLLNLQLAPIPGDAVPSRPMIFQVVGF